MKKLSLLLFLSFFLPWIAAESSAATIELTVEGHGTVTVKDHENTVYTDLTALPTDKFISLVITPDNGCTFEKLTIDTRHPAGILLGEEDMTSKVTDGVYEFDGFLSDTFAKVVKVVFAGEPAAEPDPTPEYCKWEGNSSHSSRYTNGFNLANQNGDEFTVSGCQSGIRQAIYCDKTENVATFKAGDEVTFTLTSGISWMHTYIYADWNNDGEFNCELDATSFQPTENSEVVGFTALRKSKVGSTEVWVNSANATVGDNVSPATPIKFTIPADLPAGDYRFRAKVDWNCIDACPSTDHRNDDGNVETIATNGGVIIDVTLRVEAAEAPANPTVTVDAVENGVVLVMGSDVYLGAGESKELAYGTEIAVVAGAYEGYMVESITANGEPLEFERDGNNCTAQYTVTEDVTFSANIVSLAGKKFNVTAAEVENGVIVVNGTAGFITGGMTEEFTYGDEVQIMVKAADGYEVESITANGETIEFTLDDGTCMAEYTITSDVTIDANIIKSAARTFTLTIEEPAYGRLFVSTNGAMLQSGAEIEEGTPISISHNCAGTDYVAHFITVNGTPIAFERIANGMLGTTEITATGDMVIAAIAKPANIEAQDYCTLEGNSSHTSRYTTSVSLTGSNGNSKDIVNLQSGTKQKIYWDATEQVAIMEAGEEVTVKAGYVGEWMHAYLYVDYDNDGVFSTEGLNNYLPTKTTELVAYTTFNRGEAKGGSDEYVDSDGRSRAGSYHAGNAMKFTLPASLLPGSYRARLKVDWSDLAPCPDPNRQNAQGSSNSILNNGGIIADFTIRIKGDRTVSVTVNDEALGTAAIIDPETEGTTITTDKSVKVKATATDEDAYFVNWTNQSLAVVSTSSEYTYEGGDNVTLRANFRQHYLLTVNDAENGTKVMTDEEIEVKNGEMVDKGTVLTVTCSAVGKTIGSILINGKDCTSEYTTYGHCRFTMEEATVIEVEYALPEHELTIVKSGLGDVYVTTEIDEMSGEPIGDFFRSGRTIPDGTEVYIVATPYDGKMIESLIVDGVTYIENGKVVEASDDLKEYAESKSVSLYYFVFDKVNISATFVDDESAIESIGVDELNGAEIYNLQGVRVARENLVPGIYVRVNAAGAQKVYIK